MAERRDAHACRSCGGTFTLSYRYSDHGAGMRLVEVPCPHPGCAQPVEVTFHETAYLLCFDLRRAEEEAVAPRSEVAGPSQEQIAKRAYELYLARGAGEGRDQEDWFAAERELGGEELTFTDD